MATSQSESSTSADDSLLVVAALGREINPLIRRRNHHLTLLETGEGRRNAGQSLRSRLKQRRVHAVLGIGFAGALSSALRVGDLVVAREVRGPWSSAAPPELIAAAEQIKAGCDFLHFGVNMTVDKIADAQAKRELAGGLSADQLACVDMESSALAEVCAENSALFLGIRCITDELEESLPIDFDACRDGSGNVSLALEANAVLRRPQALPSLLC